MWGGCLSRLLRHQGPVLWPQQPSWGFSDQDLGLEPGLPQGAQPWRREGCAGRGGGVGVGEGVLGRGAGNRPPTRGLVAARIWQQQDGLQRVMGKQPHVQIADTQRQKEKCCQTRSRRRRNENARDRGRSRREAYGLRDPACDGGKRRATGAVGSAPVGLRPGVGVGGAEDFSSMKLSGGRVLHGGSRSLYVCLMDCAASERP